MKPVLVNVGIGNIESVERALHFLGLSYRTINEPSGLEDATHVILPGVGAFRSGMERLHAHGMVEPLRRLAAEGSARLLGVCLGMQLLGLHSEEGDCEGLGVLPFRVTALQAAPEAGIKVPHVGFSEVEGYDPVGFFTDLPDRADFYFTHSFAMQADGLAGNFGYCVHGTRFVAAFECGRIFGAQFHPEKSQANGLRLLKNFFG